MNKGNEMDILREAKELMEKAGCKKAFAVYRLELRDTVDVKNPDKCEEAIEVEEDVGKLVSTMMRELVLDQEEPIECPLDTALSKYLEFSLKDRSIVPYNIGYEECKRIEVKMRPFLDKYNWTVKKDKLREKQKE